MKTIKIAQLQLPVTKDKEANIVCLRKYMAKPEVNSADFVTLPEMWNCPYRTKVFPIFAEEEGGRTWQECSKLAKEYKVYLAAGSIPERDEEGRIYNTSYVFDRNGRQIAKHRKVHLFDIDVKGGQRFKESDTLSAGDTFSVFNTEFGKVGMCICYDFRFPETGRLLALKGAKLIIVPASFNMTTGPAHWEVMFRGRAIENQVFTIGTAPARDETDKYVSWAHSIAVDPWGKVIGELDEEEGILETTIDLEIIDSVREQLPLMKHRREDLYDVIEKQKRDGDNDSR